MLSLSLSCVCASALIRLQSTEQKKTTVRDNSDNRGWASTALNSSHSHWQAKLFTFFSSSLCTCFTFVFFLFNFFCFLFFISLVFFFLNYSSLFCCDGSFFARYSRREFNCGPFFREFTVKNFPFFFELSVLSLVHKCARTRGKRSISCKIFITHFSFAWFGAPLEIRHNQIFNMYLLSA